MAGFTQRLAGWTAGRLGGSKARERTMDWMEKTGLGKALSFAGDAAITGSALKGIGGLKNLMTGGQAAAATPTTAFDAASGSWVPKGTEFNPVSPGTAGFEPTTLAQMPGSTAVQAPAVSMSPPVGGPLKPLPKMVSNRMTDRFNIGPNAMRSPITSVPASAQAALPPITATNRMSSLGQLLGTGARRAYDLARENPEITAALLQGGIEAYGGAAEREMMRQEMLRRRQQQENLASLLMPMYAQYYGIGG